MSIGSQGGKHGTWEATPGAATGDLCSGFRWSSTPSAGTVSGEVLVNAGTQIIQTGDESGQTANVYGYSYSIPDGKTVQSIVLPNNKAIGILGISLL